MKLQVTGAKGRPDKDLDRIAVKSFPDFLSRSSHPFSDSLFGLPELVLFTEEAIDQFLLVPLTRLQQALRHSRI